MGHYYEMEKYYHSLPEKEILASPALMQAMSMLCAMEMDYEKSEQWYEALKQFAEQCDRMDAGGRQARSRLAWLDISLPQREVSGPVSYTHLDVYKRQSEVRSTNQYSADISWYWICRIRQFANI